MSDDSLCEACLLIAQKAPMGQGHCIQLCGICSIYNAINSLFKEREEKILEEIMKKSDEETCVFRVDSHRLLEWINSITLVNNYITEGKLFSAGFELCFLQQCMVECLKDLEKQEKES